MLLVARLQIDSEGILEKIAKVKKAEAELSMALSDLDNALRNYHAKEGDSEESLEN